jgi:hypothetical protein
MAIRSIFSVSTLICLGITLLLVGVVSMFFMQRMNEQNHKFASMLGLVSTMADEVGFIRTRVQLLSAREINREGGGIFEDSVVVEEPVNFITASLINVSDDEESEDDSDEDDEEDSDEDDEDEKSESDDLEKLNNEEKNIKMINCDIFDKKNNEDVENKDEEDDKDENDEEDNDALDIGTDSSIDDDNFNDDDEPEEVVDLEGSIDETLILTNIDFIKSIDFSNLDKAKEFETIDYKKMSIPKLKLVVVEKGLVTDSSKLKKNELYKLLEIE